VRKEFSKPVKWEVYQRCLKDGKPHCECCGLRILGLPEYDHIIPDGLGGEPTVENCQALCGKCHRRKTHEDDRPVMTKADNQKKSAAGIRTPSRLPGSRSGKWKKKINGEVVAR
jgi:5-methylcytosine-specific restriction protein A